MDLSRLKQLNEQKNADAIGQKRHAELLLDNTNTQEVIVKSFAKLVEYLDRKVTKTEVVNQLREISTPDVENVVTALASLHDTLKKHKNVDLSQVTSVMQGVLEEVKQIPKENPKLPEQKFVDYSKQLVQLEKSLQSVEKAIKAQELKVDAPVVNVPETVVNVDKPDLAPIEKSISTSSKDVVKAVKGIKMPEFKTKSIEDLLKKTNKLLDGLPELMPSGGGGGGSSWPAINSAGTPLPLNLDSSGNLKIAGTTTVDTTGLATSTKQSDGTQKTQIVDNGGSIAADVLDLTNSNPLTTALVDANGDQITSFGGGTQYTEGDTDASFTGTISLVEGAANAAVTLKQPTQPTDTQPISANALPLPTGAATAANQQTDALTDTELRATPVPVSGTFYQATQPVSGTVTANAGTNLNTSALATEAGNLATIKTNTDKIPSQGQALAAASTPVVLPAAQITTLTPPAAITGFATSANQATIIGHVDGIEAAVDGIETLVGTTNSTLTTIDGRVDGLETLVTSTNTKLDTANTSLGTLDNAIAGSEMQVDVVAALPAGTNAIGKLSANSGVDIGDVDVTSIAAGTNIIGGVNPTPSGAAAQALTNDTSAAYEASSVTKASAGTVYGVTGYNSKTSAQFFQFFNSTTVPADATAPVITIRVAAQSNFSIDFGVYGRRFSTGISWSNSSTGATKTIGSADMFVDVNYV